MSPEGMLDLLNKKNTFEPSKTKVRNKILCLISSEFGQKDFEIMSPFGDRM